MPPSIGSPMGPRPVGLTMTKRNYQAAMLALNVGRFVGLCGKGNVQKCPKVLVQSRKVPRMSHCRESRS